MVHVWLVEKNVQIIHRKNGESRRVGVKHAFEVVPHTRHGSVPLPPGEERDAKAMLPKPACGEDAEAWPPYGIDRTERCWACRNAIKVAKEKKLMAQMRLF